MKNKTVFVDTGAWFALADTSDQHHGQSVRIYPDILKNYNIITTNLVIAETYILIRRNIGHSAAIAFLENISASPRIAKIYSDNLLEKIAEDILRKYDDQDFSFVDAVSFSVMRQHRIKLAFAFDRHFLTAGFHLLP